MTDVAQAELRARWALDGGVTHLNHGSFGACPIAVLEQQRVLRDRLEADPTHFFNREAPLLLAKARSVLGDFLGAEADDLAFVPNVSTAINAVLRSLPLRAGDTLVVSSHEYNATRNIIDYVAAERGCRVEMAEIPFPIRGPEEAIAAIFERVDERTRLLVIDHVTSQTALVLPLAEILDRARALGVPVLVDAAHAPGMLDVNISELAPAYYMGNCHKWLCAPKGVGFLWVRRDLQDEVRPTVISHGANAGLRGPDRFREEFDWMGTDDPTPALCVPDAIRHLESLVPGGWPEIRRRNRALCLEARRVVTNALGIAPPCPDEMIGSLASLPVPASPNFPEAEAGSALDEDPLAAALYDRHRIQVPILGSRACSGRLLRISCHLYNQLSDYEKLGDALRSML